MILVVYLFLQGWRATLIPLLAVPVSLIGTFVLFPVFGFSINTLSLFGLVLAIGLVVDDAIVVVEGVERHIEEGLAPKAAALKAMEELSGPVIGIALVLSAVFVPTAFIPGITGRLYQQFAVTIAISVLLSAFNALTLSPALAALVAAAQERERADCCGSFFDWFNRVFERATDGYVRWSAVLIRKAVIDARIAGGLWRGGVVFLASRVPSSFLPDEDQGYAFVNLQLPNGASLERTTAAAAECGENSGEYAWSPIRDQRRGLQFVELCAHQLQRVLLCHSSNRGTNARRRAEQFQAIKAAPEPATQQAPGGNRVQLLTAGDSGRRYFGRIHFYPRRSRR